MSPLKVLYAAAHGGFNLSHVPLGGGAMICERLCEEWGRQKPFPFELLSPSAVMGENAPAHKELVQFSEWSYARFCQNFEKQTTQKILQSNPQDTVILCNDISEGPNFRALAAQGYSLYTIYHVDVVDYVSAIYLRSRVKPETTTALYRTLGKLGLAQALPAILKLIWAKQEASVQASKGLIVPSERMKEVLLRCYPELKPSRVHVLPWGVWEEKEPASGGLPIDVMPGSWVLLTLSRLSPEKGQDRLLKALALWEKQADFPQQGITLLIAGEAAYMMGTRYERELKSLAAKLKKCRVEFVGYAAGDRKKSLFNMSDLYVFCSKHESYGLTLLEALREGKPVLATPSHGAADVFRPQFGEMIEPGPESAVPRRLVESLRRLLKDRSRLRSMGQSAALWAGKQRFSDTAARLAALLAR